MSDISALLPGGKTKVPDLTTNNIFSLRDGGSTVGNAAFGTAVEVDGVRIGNNGSFGNMNGVDTVISPWRILNRLKSSPEYLRLNTGT